MWLWGRDGEDFIFRGNKSAYTKKPITTQQYARIVKGWMADLPHKLMKGQDASEFSTHSLRKTKASIVYGRTRNIEAVRMILGHRSVTATSAYLGVTEKDATDLFGSAGSAVAGLARRRSAAGREAGAGPHPPAPPGAESKDVSPLPD